MLEVYERAYRLYVVTYKVCQMPQSWDKLLSTSTSTELHRDCGITVRSSGKWFCPMSNKNAGFCLQDLQWILKSWTQIEIKLFIKMLYGVWSSLQPDHGTNKSPRRMQVSPPARNDNRSPIWNIWRPHIFSLSRISTKDFPHFKGKIDWSIGINYSSVDFKWTQVFLCCQSFDCRCQWIL